MQITPYFVIASFGNAESKQSTKIATTRHCEKMSVSEFSWQSKSREFKRQRKSMTQSRINKLLHLNSHKVSDSHLIHESH